MTTLSKKMSADQILILVLFFLASMNVFGKYFYCIFFALAIFLFANRKFKINAIFVSLLLFSTLYVLILPAARTSPVSILKQFSYPICYLIGYNMLKSDDETDSSVQPFEQMLFWAIVGVATGSFSHFLLNMFHNIGSTTRNAIDIWSGNAMAATGQAVLACLGLALFITMIFSARKKLVKILCAIGCLAIFAYNLILSGRLLILLMLILFAEAFIFTTVREHKQKVVLRCIGLIVVLLILYLVLTLNIAGIAEWIGGSNLADRLQNMSFLDDSRMAIKVQYLTRLLDYPFGGAHIRSSVGSYAHDILLDTYSDIGMIGCLLLAGVLFVFVMQWIRVVRNKNYSAWFRLLILCTYTVILFIFFMEPIVSGMPWLFCSLCLFQGMIASVS